MLNWQYPHISMQSTHQQRLRIESFDHLKPASTLTTPFIYDIKFAKCNRIVDVLFPPLADRTAHCQSRNQDPESQNPGLFFKIQFQNPGIEIKCWDFGIENRPSGIFGS